MTNIQIDEIKVINDYGIDLTDKLYYTLITLEYLDFANVSDRELNECITHAKERCRELLQLPDDCLIGFCRVPIEDD